MHWINSYVEDHIIYFNRERRIAFVVEAGYSLCKKLVKKNYHVVIGVKDIKKGLTSFAFSWKSSVESNRDF